jgi:hypothetical protein
MRVSGRRIKTYAMGCTTRFVIAWSCFDAFCNRIAPSSKSKTTDHAMDRLGVATGADVSYKNFKEQLETLNEPLESQNYRGAGVAILHRAKCCIAAVEKEIP